MSLIVYATIYHEPLPCDFGEQHSHFCLHGQQSTPALRFSQGFTSAVVKLALLAKSDWISSFQYSHRTICAPPFFSQSPFFTFPTYHGKSRIS